MIAGALVLIHGLLQTLNRILPNPLQHLSVMTDILSVMTDTRSKKKHPAEGAILPFPHITGYWVNRLASAIRTVVDRELKAFDMTRRQVGMIMHIERFGSPSASDLTQTLGVDSTAVTRMIDRLEEKGLVERHPDPDDGRRHLIEVTKEARSLMPKLKRTAGRVEATFVEGVSPEDLETFQRVLLRMLDNAGEAGGAVLYREDD
ncbi:MAG: MarR family transcriptional regulator [Planctomycetota bacterium]